MNTELPAQFILYYTLRFGVTRDWVNRTWQSICEVVSETQSRDISQLVFMVSQRSGLKFTSTDVYDLIMETTRHHLLVLGEPQDG